MSSSIVEWHSPSRIGGCVAAEAGAFLRVIVEPAPPCCRRWYRCIIMVVDPEASLRGTAGPPNRLVRRLECRPGVKIKGLGRNLLDAPRADVLVEGPRILQRSEGRAAVWSERRPQREGMGDGRGRGRGPRYSDARAAARGTEEHVPGTCSPWSSPSSHSTHQWPD